MRIRILIAGLTAMVLLATASVGVATVDGVHEPDNGATLPAAVRQATERFQDLSEAIAAGYQLFQGCVSGPEEGAMGVHYVNPALFDDQLDVEHPEALVYEPKHGGLQLVAVEYITPAAAWQGSHAPGVQPQLKEHLLHFAPGPNRYGPDAFYELHVWAWKANPNGAFADWNPNVSCASWRGTTSH